MAQADRARRIEEQLGKRLAPPTGWQVKIGDVIHDVVINGEDVTVDGEAIEMALEYTPGDRPSEAACGEEQPAVKNAPARFGLVLYAPRGRHKHRTLPPPGAGQARNIHHRRGTRCERQRGAKTGRATG